jgi:NAD(P)H dehydrogenase (quinone)
MTRPLTTPSGPTAALWTPTYVGVVSWQMMPFWDDISQRIWGKMDGKIGCAFSTSGGWGGGAELTCLSLPVMMMDVGTLTFGVTDDTGPQFTPHDSAVTASKPREDKAIAAARRLGKRLAQ